MSQAQNLRRDWGEPPWRRSTLPRPPGSLPTAPDVAIVGGGLTGVAAAYHLARGGCRVVLFEADHIGSGASGRTGGIALEGTATGPRDGARNCLAGLRALVDETGIECGLQLRGCWEIEHRASNGAACLPWTDGEAPIRIARTVSGGAVEPGALVTGLAEAAIAAGAVICENDRADQIVFSPALKIKVKDEEISPGHVIVALNAWTGALVPRLPDLRSALTYACMTEPLSEAVLTVIGLADRIPFYTADTPYLWGRMCDDRSVVFGAGLTYGAPHDLEMVGIGAAEPAAVLDRLVSRVRGLTPMLARTRIIARWAGPIAFRSGALPILTRLIEAPQVLIAGAYAGHGVAFSVHAGKLMAAAITDGAPLPEWGRIK